MSVLSWRARQAHLAPRSNQQPKYPQTALSMQLAPRSTQQPKYSLKRHDLHVAFALHVMGVYVRPFIFACIWQGNQAGAVAALHPYITNSLSVHPSFLPSQAYDKQLMSPERSTGRPSTKYSFNGPIHDAFLLSWHHEARTHSSLVRAARSVSPKAIWRASSSNPFAKIRMVPLCMPASSSME